MSEAEPDHAVREHFIAKNFRTIEELFKWVETFGPEHPKWLDKATKLHQATTGPVKRKFSQPGFDFGWVPTNLIGGACHYECACQAVIEADLALPAKQFPDPLLQEIYDRYTWERIGRQTLFGPIWYLRFCDPGPQDFPLSPFQLVVPKLEDPVWFSRNLEDHWRAFHSKAAFVSVRVPGGLSKEEASQYFLKEYMRQGACPRRGAGASVRQHKTILKYLGATRALNHLSRANGLRDSERLHSDRARRLVWSALVAEAKILTTDALGKPLLESDQERAKAQRFITQLLAQYQSEIEWLRLSVVARKPGSAPDSKKEWPKAFIRYLEAHQDYLRDIRRHSETASPNTKHRNRRSDSFLAAIGHALGFRTVRG